MFSLEPVDVNNKSGKHTSPVLRTPSPRSGEGSAFALVSCRLRFGIKGLQMV